MSAILSLKFKGSKSFAPYDLSGADTLTETWKVCAKVSRCLEQGHRLENLSWRLWHLQNLTVASDNALRKWGLKKLFKLPGGKLSKEQRGSVIGLEEPTAATIANDVINYDSEKPSSLTSNTPRPLIPQNDRSLLLSLSPTISHTPHHPTYTGSASYGEGPTSKNDNYLDYFDPMGLTIEPPLEPPHPWSPTTSFYQALLSEDGPFWVAASDGRSPLHSTTQHPIDNAKTPRSSVINSVEPPHNSQNPFRNARICQYPIDNAKTPRSSVINNVEPPHNSQNPFRNVRIRQYPIDNAKTPRSSIINYFEPPPNPQNPFRNARTPQYPIDNLKTPWNTINNAKSPQNPLNPFNNARIPQHPIDNAKTPRNSRNDAKPPPNPQNPFRNARTPQYPINDVKTPRNPIDNPKPAQNPFNNVGTPQYPIDDAKTPQNPINNAKTPTNPFAKTPWYPIDNAKTPQNPICPSVPGSRRGRYKSRFGDRSPESPRSPRRYRAHSPNLREGHSPGPSDRSSESTREQRQTRTRSRDRGSRSGSVSEGHQSPEDDGESKKKVDWLT